MNFIIFIPLILGWLSGWLVNYLSDVLPVTRRLYRPPCQVCLEKFSWQDYLLFHNCRKCGHRRSPRTLIVQALFTVVPALIWIFPSPVLPFPLALITLIYLAVVFVIDFEHRVILSQVSIIGGFLGLGVGLFLRGGTSIVHGLIFTLLGGLAGFAVMLLFYYIGVLFVKQMSKRRSDLPKDEVALGYGDVYLAGILGLFLGWQLIFVSLFFAIVCGGLVSLAIILWMLATKKYRPFSAIPYAPFLIISALYFLFL